MVLRLAAECKPEFGLQMFFRVNPAKGLLRGCNDGGEVLGLQGGAANEAAVHVGLGQQLGSVAGVHGAAVLDGDCLLYTSPSPRDRG